MTLLSLRDLPQSKAPEGTGGGGDQGGKAVKVEGVAEKKGEEKTEEQKQGQYAKLTMRTFNTIFTRLSLPGLQAFAVQPRRLWDRPP